MLAALHIQDHPLLEPFHPAGCGVCIAVIMLQMQTQTLSHRTLCADVFLHVTFAPQDLLHALYISVAFTLGRHDPSRPFHSVSARPHWEFPAPPSPNLEWSTCSWVGFHVVCFRYPPIGEPHLRVPPAVIPHRVCLLLMSFLATQYICHCEFSFAGLSVQKAKYIELLIVHVDL